MTRNLLFFVCQVPSHDGIEERFDLVLGDGQCAFYTTQHNIIYLNCLQEQLACQQ
jgi:hypothetical protein